MTFSETDHPRSSDGTFIEKVGAAPELELSASGGESEAARAALAEYLDVDIDNVSLDDDLHYDHLPVYSVGDKEYAFGSEEQAQEAAKLYISENLWCQNSRRLGDETGLDSAIFDAIAERGNGGETYQDDIERIVEKLADDGVDGYAERLIEDEGRGPSLSTYDGEENIIMDQDGEWYLYRIQ